MLGKPVTATLCFLYFFFLGAGVYPQSAGRDVGSFEAANAIQDAKVERFLREDKELSEIYPSRFTGRFTSIPQPVQGLLDKAFPNYQFRIAEMEILIDLPWKQRMLIVATRRDNGEVTSFVWGGMWTMPSRSFEKIVYGESAKTSAEATEKVSAFAELVAFAGPMKVGRKSTTSKWVEVEILTREDNTSFRKLRLETKPGSKLGKFIILRQDGKRIKSL